MSAETTRDLDTGELLRSAARWLDEAQDAVAKAQWVQAETALKLAETTFASGSDLAAQIAEHDLDAKAMLEEGRALCTLLRSDIALRHWKLAEAEAHLDEAYKVLKQGEGLGVELWRLTARLAERRGRWTSAFAAWKKAAKLFEGKNEFALADAWIRLAEVALIEGKVERSQEYVDKLEPLCRDLDSDLLRARVLLLQAAELEAQQAFDAASDVYKDAEKHAAEAPRGFLGLLKLRMAGTLVHGNPRRALKKLEEGYEDLLALPHPDADGLVLSQIAILALILKRPEVAGLAAIGAEVRRGGLDGTSRPILCASLRQLDENQAADEVTDIEVNVLRHTQVARALDPTVQKLELTWDALGKPASVAGLLGALKGIEAGRIQVRVEDSVVLTDQNALYLQRASLTWDAPQGRLVSRAPPPPMPVLAQLIKATAPAAPERVPSAPSEPPRILPPALPWGQVSLGMVFVVTFAFFLGVVLAAVLLRAAQAMGAL